MDDALRRELAQLRRRAYGRGGGLDDDPEGLARLIDLEALVRSERATDAAWTPAPSRAPAGGAAPVVDIAGPLDHVGAASVAAAGHPRRVRPVHARPPVAGDTRARSLRWPVALAGIAVAATVVIVALSVVGGIPPAVTEPTPGFGGLEGLDEVTRDAYTLARDEEARVLLRVPLDGSFGNYIDLSTEGPIPAFPASGAPRWTALLGEYYGWRLWIAGTAGAFQDEQCLLLENGTDARGRCVPAALRESAALAVTLDYDQLTPGERTGFAPGDRVGFWWHIDREVTVLLAAQEGARPDSSESPSE